MLHPHKSMLHPHKSSFDMQGCVVPHVGHCVWVAGVHVVY